MGLNSSKSKKFQNDFKKFTVDLENFNKEFLLSEVGEVLRSTIRKTPVDTGDLKASWAMSDIRKDSLGYFVRVENSQNYASWVESGHMTTGANPWWLPGVFMFKTSLDAMERNLNKKYRNKFEKFKKGYNI